MDIPLTELIGADACFAGLVKLFDPYGLACPAAASGTPSGSTAAVAPPC
jgi:hypothetical protein